MCTDEWVTSQQGIRSPRILYGTAWKKSRTAELVRQAIEAGFRGIDTACQPQHYDEAGVGAGVAACLGNGLRRENLYLQTKFTPLSGHDPRQIPYDPRSPLADQIAQSFKTSLRNLRTHYVDGLVLHAPLPDARDNTEVWQAMEAIVDAGGARRLGISNCYGLGELERLHDSSRIKPAIVQNRFYAATGYDTAIRAFCRGHHVLYQSFWTLTANPQLLAHPVVTMLALRYGRSPAQILFRFLTQDDVVPLTGTKSMTHMREDLQIFEFALSGSERDAMAKILRQPLMA
ncbi:MAG: aldo/keto reductase [Steroidobacteraceae bacterium]